MDRQKKRYELKNLYTGVSALRTISEIEEMLAQMGATDILKTINNDNGVQITAVIFQLRLKSKCFQYRLPMDINRTRQVITEMVDLKILPYKFSQEPHRTERAQMVGWRIIKDWIYAQLSLAKMQLADPLQIFLPYLWNGENTLGQLFMDNKLQLEDMRFKTKK